MANQSRRKFLQQLTKSSAFLAFLSPTAVVALAHKQKEQIDNILSFTDLDGLGPDINAQLIENNFIALHEERELPVYTIDPANRQYVEWLFREMVSNKGLSWDESDRLVWTYQYYGFCDHSGHCDKLLRYSRSAQDYLYNSVSGLLDVDVNWSLLSDDYDYSSPDHVQFKGVIGRYTYLMSRVWLSSAEGEIKDYGLITSTPLNRAINYVTSNGNELNTSLIYLIPGVTSLMSPFSELLHLTTHGPSRRLVQQLGLMRNPHHAEETSRIVGETITESAAILMAQQYLNKNRHGDRINIINAHANYMSNQYSLIPDTVDYMKLHGVQQTLAHFNDDPLHLVKEISHLFNKLVV